MGMPAQIGGCRSGMDRGYWGGELPRSTLLGRLTGTGSLAPPAWRGSATIRHENELLGRSFVTHALKVGGADGTGN